MADLDWEQLFKTVLGHVGKAAVKAANQAVDSVLEDADAVLKEGRRRVKAARSHIPRPPAEKPAPQPDVIDAEIEE